MIKTLLALVFLIPFPSFALELKVGDILLQPLHCWTCMLIEQQENSIYSHMGLVIQTKPKVVVVEAIGKVRTTSLEEFKARTKKNHLLSVRRFKDERVVQYLQDHRQELVQEFSLNYHGLEYDADFLWDNLSQDGQEKLYCSEMITKLLEGFLKIPLPIKKMNYTKNRELWIQYFKGSPPDGKWGNAPADFEKSKLFYEVGEL